MDEIEEFESVLNPSSTAQEDELYKPLERHSTCVLYICDLVGREGGGGRGREGGMNGGMEG